jgi:hypothetical protein
LKNEYFRKREKRGEEISKEIIQEKLPEMKNKTF